MTLWGGGVYSSNIVSAHTEPKGLESTHLQTYLEANTLPGMTERSLLPLAAQAKGEDMGSLCLEILAQGLASSTERRRP